MKSRPSLHQQTTYWGYSKTVLALLLDFDMSLDSLCESCRVWEGLPQKYSEKPIGAQSLASTPASWRLGKLCSCRAWCRDEDLKPELNHSDDWFLEMRKITHSEKSWAGRTSYSIIRNFKVSNLNMRWAKWLFPKSPDEGSDRQAKCHTGQPHAWSSYGEESGGEGSFLERAS